MIYLFEDLTEPTLSTGDIYTINPIANATIQNSKISFDLTAQVGKLVQGSSISFDSFY